MKNQKAIDKKTNSWYTLLVDLYIKVEQNICGCFYFLQVRLGYSPRIKIEDNNKKIAGVLELADKQASDTCVFNMRVQVPSPAPNSRNPNPKPVGEGFGFLFVFGDM